MAERTWRKAFLLAAVGITLAAGCTINSEDGDDDEGEAGSSGTGGKGGSGGTAGKGGSSGSAGKGGASGSGGSTAGTAGTAGKGGSAGGGGSSGTAGTGGSEAGAAGAVDTRTDPLCDPDSGELPSTPYDCSPAPGEEEDPCALCIQENCCEESENCYAYDPGNVCGWGGPAEGGEYLGGGEIGCMRSCILEFVEENGVYDSTAEDDCASSCATETDSAGMECGGLLGNATSLLMGCMHESCESECFEIP